MDIQALSRPQTLHPAGAAVNGKEAEGRKKRIFEICLHLRISAMINCYFRFLKHIKTQSVKMIKCVLNSSITDIQSAVAWDRALWGKCVTVGSGIECRFPPLDWLGNTEALSS
jgi:hypothetical protein